MYSVVRRTLAVAIILTAAVLLASFMLTGSSLAHPQATAQRVLAAESSSLLQPAAQSQRVLTNTARRLPISPPTKKVNYSYGPSGGSDRTAGRITVGHAPDRTPIPTNTASATPSLATYTPTPQPITPTVTLPLPTITLPPNATATMTGTPATPEPTATTCPNPFVDISNNTFYQAIMYLYCRGIVNGLDATHYGPGGTASRAQFAKVVVLGFNVPSYTPTSTFTDVPITYFAYQYIEAGYNVGILSGFDQASCQAAGTVYPCYLPNRPITRAQLTKLVVNAAGYTLYTPTTFSDVLPSNVFYVPIETAVNKRVINGYPNDTFLPDNPIRRDEMAQIVYKAITTP